ncbi:MAG TPA: hypothetical protein VLE89_03280 [Chlamydiales bacterium]|nr:hypothetical protein [Chlamydiales bacterium]
MDGIRGVGGSKGHIHYISPTGSGFTKKQKAALHELSEEVFGMLEESCEATASYVNSRVSGLPRPTEKQISKKELRYTAGRIADKAANIFNV